MPAVRAEVLLPNPGIKIKRSLITMPCKMLFCWCVKSHCWWSWSILISRSFPFMCMGVHISCYAWTASYVRNHLGWGIAWLLAHGGAFGLWQTLLGTKITSGTIIIITVSRPDFLGWLIWNLLRDIHEDTTWLSLAVADCVFCLLVSHKMFVSLPSCSVPLICKVLWRENPSITNIAKVWQCSKQGKGIFVFWHHSI